MRMFYGCYKTYAKIKKSHWNMEAARHKQTVKQQIIYHLHYKVQHTKTTFNWSAKQ